MCLVIQELLMEICNKIHVVSMLANITSILQLMNENHYYFEVVLFKKCISWALAATVVISLMNLGKINLLKTSGNELPSKMIKNIHDSWKELKI